MIYFDENKTPYNTPVEGYIATCDETRWAYFSEHPDEWDIINGEFTDLRDTEEYQAKKEAERQEEIDNLCLTGADVERAIYKDKEMDFDDLIEYVKTNVPTMDVKALKIELKANNFYRSHPYICKLGALLGYSSEELDYLFQFKELPPKEVPEDTADETSDDDTVNEGETSHEETDNVIANDSEAIHEEDI